ncbi:MAG: preprotein translocase subunit SecA [Fastidiosipilaceae bacterium]|jgi:preprotein translocase subunit SecA
MSLWTKIFGTYSEKELKRNDGLLKATLALESEYEKLGEAQLKAKTAEFKDRLAAGETLDNILPEAFAAVRESAWRVLDMKHYPVQVQGGIVLHQGRIAEMKTGEGKTLVATLPVYLNALSGEGVHVVTVNDYLARRDSEWMGKVYRYLGLSVGLIVHGISKEERREAYSCDITYGTNNEFGFDYLRDNMVIYKEDMVQRELNFAIVDEVDSILIDEARTPLIISGKGDASTDMYVKADQFVKRLRKLVVTEIDTKEDLEAQQEGYDYVVDEKAKSATLTARGVVKAEKFFKLDNYADEANFDLQHYLNNALKANGTMHRDDQYVLKDGKIVIVDDFTGRLMFGRRYSDGLHQAIEAKEGVDVQHESKTLATITFQNYFRMYRKLSGMTGTALTEEDEFRSIYGLDVIEIPTNMPNQRVDLPDAVYKTGNGKYRALMKEVMAAHEKGQPILIGTVSVERSEFLSSMFNRYNIRHNVLNAKKHDREAEIVAQAGRFGSVTIATNMAGRGTDILLGGNPEFMARQQLRKMGYDDELIEQSTAHNETDDEAVLDIRRKFRELEKEYSETTKAEHERVVDAGGLYIIGTERHESRRIDNQLRGRSGRQGDPGKSKFYLSLDDDLMRLFGGERLNNLFETLGVDEDMQIEAKLLSSSIESAQRKVEGRNFGIRKNVLDYDNVMNQQREMIYAQRRQVLDGADLREFYERNISELAEDIVATYCDPYTKPEDRNLQEMVTRLCDLFGLLPVIKELKELNTQSFEPESFIERLKEGALERYHSRESELGSADLMREVERVVLLKSVDQYWMDHIDTMDELRNSIGLRGIGQHDPVIEYQKEGTQMFDEMSQLIQEESIKLIMRGTFTTNGPPKRESQAKDIQESREESGGQFGQAAPTKRATSQGRAGDEAQETQTPAKRDVGKVGRNEPCPCGSGKKYKNCHGKNG